MPRVYNASASPICYTSGISSTQPVIDNVSHGLLIVDGISIVPDSADNALTAGTCILAAPDSVGVGNLIVENSTLDRGPATGGSSVVIDGDDLSAVISSNLWSMGNALIMGAYANPSTVVSHYTIGAPSVTHLVASGNIIQSTLSPIVLTGSCGDYKIDNAGGVGYTTLLNGTDTTHAIIDLSYGGASRLSPSLYLDAVNLESQGGVQPFAAIATVNSSGGGAGAHVHAGIWTGRILGGAVTIAEQSIGVHFTGLSSTTIMTDTTTYAGGDIKIRRRLNYLRLQAARLGLAVILAAPRSLDYGTIRSQGQKS